MEEKLHQEILDYLHKLYINKNTDYCNAASDTYKRYGMISYLIRLEHNLNRARGNVTVKNNL